MPVMEGKAMLFKEFADVDAFPICLDTKDPDEIVQIVVTSRPRSGASTWRTSLAALLRDREALGESLDIPSSTTTSMERPSWCCRADERLPLTRRRIEDLRC